MPYSSISSNLKIVCRNTRLKKVEYKWENEEQEIERCFNPINFFQILPILYYRLAHLADSVLVMCQVIKIFRCYANFQSAELVPVYVKERKNIKHLHHYLQRLPNIFNTFKNIIQAIGRYCTGFRWPANTNTLRANYI